MHSDWTTGPVHRRERVPPPSDGKVNVLPTLWQVGGCGQTPTYTKNRRHRVRPPPPYPLYIFFFFFFNPPQLISCGRGGGGGGGGSPRQPGMATCIRLLLFYTKKQKQKPHNISAKNNNKNNTRIDQLGIVKDAKPNQTTTLLKALGVLEKKKEDSTMGPNRSVQRLRPFVAVNKGEWQRRDWWAVL